MSDQVWIAELRAQLEAHPDAELDMFDYEDETTLTIYTIMYDRESNSIQVGIGVE